MKTISIFSDDERFRFAAELFERDGVRCAFWDESALAVSDALLLPVSPCERSAKLDRALSLLKEGATVFTGNKALCGVPFKGRAIAYSEDEEFLLKNAYITALCAIRLTLERIDFTVGNKKAFISGYGRIGRYLSLMLRGLGADVFVYARGKKAVTEIELNGMKAVGIEAMASIYPMLVYNTVPYPIIKKEISDRIPRGSVILELASAPGGFEDSSVAVKEPSLPGRLMPRSAGEAIYCLVSESLSLEQEKI